jgi:hypothetical protein
VLHTRGEDTIPRKEGEARMSDSSSFPVSNNNVSTNRDTDDLTKLRRLLGYIRHTRTRGIVLRVGRTCTMMVKEYIDAAYGVHQDSGKSHTGCAIVHGESGPVFAKSAKQKIVTKSSTEAELVGLSDVGDYEILSRVDKSR